MIGRLLKLFFSEPSESESSYDGEIVTKVVYKAVEPVRQLQADYSIGELSLEDPFTLQQSDLTYNVNNEDYEDLEKNLRKYISD
jgi:hypothetical protein